MASSPQYTSLPISAAATLATANLNRDGVTGTVVTAYTFRSGANGGTGGRIDTLTITAPGTSATVLGNVLMFINGTPIKEIAITAITPSATVKGYTIPTSEGADANGVLAISHLCVAGDVVKFCVTTSQALIARVEGGEF